MNILDELETDLDKVTAIQNMLVARATGGDSESGDYSLLRQVLIENPVIKEKLPDFVIRCRSLDQFWGFIKPMYGSYQERRDYIYSEFQSILDYLEGISNGSPNAEIISYTLQSFDENGIHKLWIKALERKNSDPEGAITVARTLVESVCKHILDKQQVVYKDDGDLNKLYKEAAKTLNLSPEQHSEQVFKQILSGCSSVVQGLGTMRNSLSDSHGQGIKPVKPSPRHAEFAINLAGTMALFLIETFMNKGAGK